LKEETGTGSNYQVGQLPGAINELALVRKQAGRSLNDALLAASRIRQLQDVFAQSDDPFLKEFQARVERAVKADLASVAGKELTERLGELANQLNKCE